MTGAPMEDASLVEVLTRIDTKLDTALNRGEDHEKRLRAQEARRTVSPRDLWLGIGSAAGAGAAIASIIQAFVK